MFKLGDFAYYKSVSGPKLVMVVKLGETDCKAYLFEQKRYFYPKYSWLEVVEKK